MKVGKRPPVESRIELSFDLDEAPEKVWRAVSLPEFRARWLPAEALASPEAFREVPQRAISYLMRDDQPPFLESTVTFSIVPRPTGGTCLQIVQELTQESLARLKRAAANNDGPLMMFAA
ncbi:SRPBCC family protein [Rhizobium sp. C1]|uniref:SRPBCC family protein n=1 Tax=Rhizobium sp. C1 TaxID=1349799 RepID=UPI001E370DFF|nr:hypothetical protein [Rhizobium sp. C1]MCD2178867.1 hypothetical protein [Rhizobium sp. C1]